MGYVLRPLHRNSDIEFQDRNLEHLGPVDLIVPEHRHRVDPGRLLRGAPARRHRCGAQDGQASQDDGKVGVEAPGPAAGFRLGRLQSLGQHHPSPALCRRVWRCRAVPEQPRTRGAPALSQNLHHSRTDQRSSSGSCHVVTLCMKEPRRPALRANR